MDQFWSVLHHILALLIQLIIVINITERKNGPLTN